MAPVALLHLAAAHRGAHVCSALRAPPAAPVPSVQAEQQRQGWQQPLGLEHTSLCFPGELYEPCMAAGCGHDQFLLNT